MSEELEQEVDAPEGDVEIASTGPTYRGPLRHKVYGGMWGPLEIAAICVAGVLLLSALLFYLLAVVPVERELANGRTERDRLDREYREANEKWGNIQDTETEVAKLLTSAEDFEARSLRDQSIGTSAVYQRVNALINGLGLRNTSGPDYVPLVEEEKRRSGRSDGSGERGRDKFKSLFPGIYITTTVEGSYPNLRRFIREIETSGEFVAITSVELEPSDEQETEAETTTVEVRDEQGNITTKSIRKGRYRGNRVSLRIEMAAYFRRPADDRLNTSIADKILEDENRPSS